MEAHDNHKSGFQPSAHGPHSTFRGNGPLHHSSRAPSFDMYSPMEGQISMDAEKLLHALMERAYNPNMTPTAKSLQHHQRSRRKSPQKFVIKSQNGAEAASSNIFQMRASSGMSIAPHPSFVRGNKPSSPFFMGDELKWDLLSRRTAMLSEVGNAAALGIPAQVDSYYNLVPLEAIDGTLINQFGHPSTVYKATSNKDMNTYCLRRVHGFKLNSTKCISFIKQWKNVSLSSIVTLQEVFTTKTFGDNSIVFVYDYHPTAETLAEKYFSTPNHNNGYANPFNIAEPAQLYTSGRVAMKRCGTLSEDVIWTYIIQLSGAIRAVHAADLSIQTLCPSKILVTDKQRLRINCVGMIDILNTGHNFETGAHQYQREDLLALGHFVLALACGSMAAIQEEWIDMSIAMVKRNYSCDLFRLIMLLLDPSNTHCSMDIVMPIIGERFYTHAENLFNKVDSLQAELMKSCENERLFRLLAKLNTILERQEFDMDSHWSETGDRYILKLFRDYVFHQKDSTGRPWIDMAHIISSLNKLDAGSSEKICLTSKDETSIIIASYSEIKRCFESSFTDLYKSQQSSQY